LWKIGEFVLKKLNVTLWGSEVGVVSWDKVRDIGIFQYNSNFIEKGIEISPLVMPLRTTPYEFPELERMTFKGLPGLLSDSLPDKFGNAIIDIWLKTQDIDLSDFTPMERLRFIGNRAMGALEFEPSLFETSQKPTKVEIRNLVELSNKILGHRAGLQDDLGTSVNQESIEEILYIGTSAGGARAKAVLAWNPTTNEFQSGQHPLEPGFEHWLIKFDGVSNNRDKERADPTGYGKIEYAYYLMALEAGIKMAECRLHHEGELSHFMTKRFDRNPDGSKIHMLSLCAIAHMDFNQTGLYSYEDAILIMRRLHLPQEDLEQFVLRAMFNVVGRNQDDHVKNIAFLMNQSSEWRLSPAFDVTYSYDPTGTWTSQHQMSINGKRDSLVKEDLISLANHAGIHRTDACEMFEQVSISIKLWSDLAIIAGVSEKQINRVISTLVI
jgi:serine/threonine-protein kinase HipA